MAHLSGTDRSQLLLLPEAVDEFERLSGKRRSLAVALSMLGLSEIERASARIAIEPREVDLT